MRVRQYGLETSPLKSRRLAARAQWAAWASAGPGGRSHALHGHVVNRTPEGEQVNPATCHLRTRVIRKHTPREA